MKDRQSSSLESHSSSNEVKQHAKMSGTSDTEFPSMSHHERQSFGIQERLASATDSIVSAAGGHAPPQPGCPDDAYPGSNLRRLGKFTLLELLGQGAFGTVFLARDEELDRMVALKIPRMAPFLTAADQDRFLGEAISAARLSHPGIVRVYDAGRVDETLFIVSEYIEGQTLAELLQHRKLTFRESTLLIAAIADAFTHAHTQGVVHRDLKPSNIMLAGKRSSLQPSPSAESEETGQSLQGSSGAFEAKRAGLLHLGQPRLMDFGLARRVEADDSATIAGELLGTPAYMSPQQARGNAYLVDGRSDIYSLGVVLYELLVHDVPFRGNLRMVLQQVSEDEPRPPRRVNDRIPRDLETITLKCLSKEPEHRYQTAAELAAELRRFLANEPIHARPVSRAERVWRWCRRNPIVALLTSTAVLAMLFGLVAATVGYVQTSRALADSEESFRQAKRAVDDLFTRVSEEDLLDQPGLQPLRRDLLVRARDYYRQFLKQRGARAISPAEEGAIHFRVGAITEELDSSVKALAEFEQARRVLEPASKSQPNNEEVLRVLGDTLNGIGRCWNRQSLLDKAEVAFRDAVKVRSTLVALAPRNAGYQQLLANAHMNLGIAIMDRNQDEGRKNLEAAQDLRQQILDQEAELGTEITLQVRLDLAKGNFNLGKLAFEIRDLNLAELAFGKALAQYSELTELIPENLQNRFEYAFCLRLAADMNMERRFYSQAESLYYQAKNDLTALVLQNPDVPGYKSALAGVYLNLSEAKFQQENDLEALLCCEQAVMWFLEVIDTQSANSYFRQDLVKALFKKLELHMELGQMTEARVALAASREILERSTADFRDDQRLDAWRNQADQVGKMLELSEAEEDEITR